VLQVVGELSSEQCLLVLIGALLDMWDDGASSPGRGGRLGGGIRLRRGEEWCGLGLGSRGGGWGRRGKSGAGQRVDLELRE